MTADAPATLSTPGRTVWDAIVGKYDLRPDELRTLEDVCAITDMVAALSQAWEDEGRPLTTKGSMGQLVIHPLIAEIKGQRMARNALWRQLKLPDEAGSTTAAMNPQREGGNARWKNAHGA